MVAGGVGRVSVSVSTGRTGLDPTPTRPPVNPTRGVVRIRGENPPPVTLTAEDPGVPLSLTPPYDPLTPPP